MSQSWWKKPGWNEENKNSNDLDELEGNSLKDNKACLLLIPVCFFTFSDLICFTLEETGENLFWFVCTSL